MKKPGQIWKDKPEQHDWPAARSYLSLLFEEKQAARLVTRLKRAKGVSFAAKDILRASGLAVSPRSNFRVAEDLRKIAKGKPLPPVLLVRGDASNGLPLLIADGYHRISASWHLDEGQMVPCRIVSRPKSK